MLERHLLKVGAMAWSAVGAAVALPVLGRVNPDARLGLGVASVLLPLCALVAAVLLDRGQDRAAGAFLLVSAATPTYFAWPLNVPSLLVGLALLVAPGIIVSPRRLRSGPTLGR